MKTFTPEEIAKVTHQANQALREILGEEGNNPSWDDASYDQRESVRIGVVGIMEGTRPSRATSSGSTPRPPRVGATAR